MLIRTALVCALSVCAFADTDGLTPTDVPFTASPVVAETDNQEPAVERKPAAKAPVVKAVFSPFTGKVKGDKVRMRLEPDLEGAVVRELHKHELLSVVGDEGSFWAVASPENVKAYVFRSFVLDNIVEGNRVNVRLLPDLEAPVIGHLNTGDQVKGSLCAANKKWLEIAPPAGVKFYVSKEYIDFAGGPDLKAQADKRKTTLQQLMESASLLSKAELQKPFQEIDFDRLKRSFQLIAQDYADFPHYVEQAKEALAQIQESYLQKRIAHLEAKAGSATTSSEEQQKEEIALSPTDRMKMWHPVEEALHHAWARAHEEKTLDEYYAHEELSSTHLSGILEAFTAPVKNKPGDYILKNKNLPVAYLYSTQIDLHNYVGKQVTLKGSVRPNHHFAFPAYYVHSVE
jgi:hypothetical protein